MAVEVLRPRDRPREGLLLVSLLEQTFDVWRELGVTREECLVAEPQSIYASDDTCCRGHEYDRRRVRYFYDRFKAGESVYPILIDAYTETEWRLSDGWHRLAGASLAGERQIQAEVYGSDEDFEYLAGLRPRRPGAKLLASGSAA